MTAGEKASLNLGAEVYEPSSGQRPLPGLEQPVYFANIKRPDGSEEQVPVHAFPGQGLFDRTLFS